MRASGSRKRTHSDSVHHFPFRDFNKRNLIYAVVRPFNYGLVHKRASFISSFLSSPSPFTCSLFPCLPVSQISKKWTFYCIFQKSGMKSVWQISMSAEPELRRRSLHSPLLTIVSNKMLHVKMQLSFCNNILKTNKQKKPTHHSQLSKCFFALPARFKPSSKNHDGTESTHPPLPGAVQWHQVWGKEGGVSLKIQAQASCFLCDTTKLHF